MATRTLGTPARLLTVFVMLSGLLLAAIGWLGWRLLQQDLALESQRLREQLDNAASLLTRELDRTLSAWEEIAPRAARGDEVTLPAHSILLVFGPGGVAQAQGEPVAYYPRLAAEADAPAPMFATAEALEFRDQNLPQAIAAYRVLAAANDGAVRAQALMRLARCLRKTHQTAAAVAAYEQLASLGTAAVAGAPAELIARRERAVLFDAIGDAAAAAGERSLLVSALRSGRFRIDRSTFEFFQEGASPAPVAGDPVHGGAVRIARAVEAFWPSWQEEPSGRAAWTGEDGAFAAVWRRTPQGTASITAPLDELIDPLRSATENLRVRLALDDRSGRHAWGSVSNGPQITKQSAETGLPWTLHVAAADADSARAVAESRRNLLIAAFAGVALVIVAASYVVFRAVNRELAVARLQSDFVAAVSHEFRTPLTAMCHLTELLEDGSAGADRLPAYYRALGKESRRLHAMVENLLDFGRMSSGRRTYELLETDPGELVEGVVREFADRAPGAANRIDLASSRSGTRGSSVIRADREALALAIRNLLDNAVKYSPGSSIVRVSVGLQHGSVRIAVEDEGPGISAQERRQIFRKFTRGAAARSSNVKGTGIGLTMADQIVRAHGGRLELESDAGKGSRFTIVLPEVRLKADTTYELVRGVRL